jgi:basic amino acid/polyamine antiporter, APA family
MTHPPSVTGVPDELRRRLGLFDAVVIGVGSMIGAGIFAALAPAAQAAWAGLLMGLALAGVVAYCNAVSSARLAACYPASGGTYVYGRMRPGDFWGLGVRPAGVLGGVGGRGARRRHHRLRGAQDDRHTAGRQS